MQEKGTIIKAWYWFAARDTFTHSFYRQQLALMANWLRYKSKEGALIRVSLRLDPNKTEALEAKANRFISQIVPILENFLKNT